MREGAGQWGSLWGGLQVAFGVGLEEGVGSGPSEMQKSREHGGRMVDNSRRKGPLEEVATLCSGDSSEIHLYRTSPPAKG